MLTPIEIQGKSFKSGIGYDKKDVDAFFKDVLANYESLYKENVELTDKLNVLSEGIQYYKTIETTLQKALVLAEMTSEETKQSAMKKASSIETEAHAKAKLIVADAKNELDHIHVQTLNLIQQYDKYKAQFKQLAATQMELLSSESFNISLANLEAFSNFQNLEQSMNAEQSTAEAEEAPKSSDNTANADQSQPSDSESIPSEKDKMISQIVNDMREIVSEQKPVEKPVEKEDDFEFISY